MSILSFSYIEESEPISAALPQPRPNGGLDTGAQASGPWGSYSVQPDPVALSKNLLSEPNLPPNAEKQPTTFKRPGNNQVEYPYHTNFNPSYNIRCLN